MCALGAEQRRTARHTTTSQTTYIKFSSEILLSSENATTTRHPQAQSHLNRDHCLESIRSTKIPLVGSSRGYVPDDCTFSVRTKARQRPDVNKVLGNLPNPMSPNDNSESCNTMSGAVPGFTSKMEGRIARFSKGNMT